MFVPASADLVSCLTLQMPLRHFITPVWHVSVICRCFSICNCPLEVWHMVAMDWYKHTSKYGLCNSSNKHELLQPHGNQLVHSVFGNIGTSCPNVPPMREFSTCCTNFLSRAGRGGRMPQMRSRIAKPMTKIDVFSQWNGMAD
jgi:hypothetical protein